MTNELTTTTPAPLTIVEQMPADGNPSLVYLTSLSEGSRRTMREALNTIAAKVLPGSNYISFPWASLRYQHTTAIRTWLASEYSPATANKMLAAMRGALKEAWRLGYMTAEEHQRAVDFKPVPGSKVQQAEKGRHLTPGEMAALLNACMDGSDSGTRDAAVIAIGYACGLRRSELAGLQVKDFDPDKGTLTIRKGKGSKERVVPVANGAKDALLDWLDSRGSDPGALFTHVLKGDHVKVGEGIDQQTVYDILNRRAEQANVPPLSPHDLRRTFAGDLLDAGADIATVQKLMGHASVTTTAGYDRRDAKVKKAAVDKLHVPYRRQRKG